MNITINCGVLGSMREFHAIISEKLDFPSYYGMNLDALYDCLTDITEECTVTLVNLLPWFEICGKDAITAIRVMQDVSQINPNFHFFFGMDNAD